MRLLALAACLLAGCSTPGAIPTGASDTLTVMLRVDDVFMHDTDIQPQEIDSFLVVAERHGAPVELSVIPQRLTAANNADGRMAESLRAYVARGHDVSQHGWSHRNARTGDTGSEFYAPDTQTWSDLDTMRAHLARGKRMLEETVGIPMIKYVSPGRDPQGAPESVAIVQALGFRWLTHDTLPVPTFTDSLAYVPNGTDYTWALADSIYDVTMQGARHDIDASLERGDDFAIVLFHDHFTRHAWNDGIMSRWLDDLLTWIEAKPGLYVDYVTVRELEARRAAAGAPTPLADR